MTSRLPPPRGFTILESLVMLCLLTVFSMLAYGVFKSGITQKPEQEDAEWLAKGGDSALSSMAELPKPAVNVPLEQPGLGGGVVRDSGPGDGATPPEK